MTEETKTSQAKEYLPAAGSEPGVQTETESEVRPEIESDSQSDDGLISQSDNRSNSQSDNRSDSQSDTDSDSGFDDDSDSGSGSSGSDEKEAVFEARCLSFAYPGESPILKNINLKIYKGDFTIIVGLNGSGKSTFAYHLNGLLRPSSGYMKVFGRDTKEPRNLPEIHRKVGIVFQNPYMQFVGNTVEEDIAFGPENLGLDRKEIKERVANVLEAVHLQGLAYQDPSTLSGGEAQAAAIAGVLAMDPECIVLDEITSMLDIAAEDRILKIIDDLRERSKTLVYISHNPQDLLKADRIIVFDKGEISFDGDLNAYIASGKYRLPDMITLLKSLRENGLDVSETISDPQEAAAEILKHIRPDDDENKEIAETVEAEEATEAEKTAETRETIEAEKTAEARETIEAEKTDEVRETIESEKIAEVRETIEAEKTDEVRETIEAGEVTEKPQ
ncbi:Vitamin B12 import ATP-binding protein BtuD [Methanimicrococcus sp. At1]|uniref:Vitamin B12 import ATP-binding protein BtuD n=1 Tax=Methanimicrococcus hacksteinii TaxID=3028293 RepID=A0ABU3VP99_9EURY|nr:ATP-binding cassette domain-containing protein [Methanimicrococcus sp. At1]MDV0445196.1 Vitamin B12 import ATP-binding protein BtuD [Methanimicrococcus sp. At1]